MPTKVTTKKVTKNTVAKTAKKAIKKTPAKRVTKKRPSKVVTNAKLLVCAPDDKCFWTTDGTILKNLEELKFAFGTMNDEVFLHHVTKERNDFADWVQHVLEDSECADALRKAKKRDTAKTVVIRHLRHYSV